ncbi:unnamed protein product [Didymodactylos carnosus]|uniref:Uncharacterized protein n=1 Tax=Didymodactylos carnosus TaxID=1234261 RepID=A0A813NNK0_9BILA|nr:unnamed protein product [Didymodactylos carnosus]CAF1266059.1 unnamed protein product [Didymodactylos carnosus]CAF3519735.1 unnamed protein product [Didymodactylos carnosus]CAF4072269.1 unnamed protein product [Didymodactylos carnosus]
MVVYEQSNIPLTIISRLCHNLSALVDGGKRRRRRQISVQIPMSAAHPNVAGGNDVNVPPKYFDGGNKIGAGGNPSGKDFVGNYLGNSPYQSNPYQQGMNNQPYYGAQGVNYPYAGQYQNQYPITGQFGQYGSQGQYGTGYQNQYNNQQGQYGYGTQYGNNYNNRPNNGQWYPSSIGYNSGYPYWNDGKQNQLNIFVSFASLFILLLINTKA